MSSEHQLAWEARWRGWAGAAAIGASFLTLASFVVIASVGTAGERTSKASALFIAGHASSALASGILRGAAYLLAAAALWYLWRAARARKPELPRQVAPLVLAGPVVYGLLSIVGALLRARSVQDFAARPAAQQTEEAARTALAPGGPVLATLGLAALLVIVFVYVFLSLQAMRVGLLPRFVGIIGVITAALIVLPLAGPPIVEVFWFTALGLIFLDRWPGGQPRAWKTGQAEPWPSQQEVMEQRVAAREERRRRKLGLPPEPQPDPEPEPEPVAAGARAAGARRRKRKR
jgi:hypothetical protein